MERQLVFDFERPVAANDNVRGERHKVGYEVFVDDNWHFMDEDERYKFGSFATPEEAIAACRKIVDECLASSFEPGMTAEALWERYKMGGEDPFVLPGVGFSAWGYAERRCSEIAGPAHRARSPQANAQIAAGLAARNRLGARPLTTQESA